MPKLPDPIDPDELYVYRARNKAGYVVFHTADPEEFVAFIDKHPTALPEVPHVSDDETTDDAVARVRALADDQRKGHEDT